MTVPVGWSLIAILSPPTKCSSYKKAYYIRTDYKPGIDYVTTPQKDDKNNRDSRGSHSQGNDLTPYTHQQAKCQSRNHDR